MWAGVDGVFNHDRRLITYSHLTNHYLGNIKPPKHTVQQSLLFLARPDILALVWWTCNIFLFVIMEIAYWKVFLDNVVLGFGVKRWHTALLFKII